MSPDNSNSHNLKSYDPKSNDSSHSSIQTQATVPSLVPKGLSIGLAVFALVLSLSGYIIRLALGEDFMVVFKQAIILVPVFVLGIPLLFWLGSLIMNRINGSNIQTRNAFTLGWLISCVTMLWLMGTYS